MGYAFMMAVKSVSPDLADALQYLQDQLSKINNLNLNSCQMAEGIVTTGVNAILSDNKEQAIAQGTGSLLSNLWPDSFQTLAEWESDNNAKIQARRQAANADPNLKEMLEPGNVVWKALWKTDVPDELKELMMSLVGTIIIVPVGEAGNENGSRTSWRYIGPTGVKFSDFVGNPESATKNDVTLLKCGSDYDCMNPIATPNRSIASLSWHVRQTMEKAAGNIEARHTQGFSGIDYAVYMNSSVPVWRLVNIATMSGSSNIITDFYAQVVATELAYNWFTEMMRTLQKALSNNTTAQSQDVVEASKSLNEQIADVRKLAASEYIAKHQQAISTTELQKTTQWLHETMLRSLPADVQKSLMVFNR
jgi:conjugative transfer pilus assembly protein TraH